MKNHALPTGTHSSVIIGLGSATSKKWDLFLKGGPYWNYIARFFASKNLFAGHPELLDVAVNSTIANVSRCFAAGRFTYKAAGVGFFRAFLKQVAIRAALTLARREKRATIGIDPVDETDILRDEQQDSRADCRTLDAYDQTGGVMAEPRRPKRTEGVKLASMTDLAGVFEDDGREGTNDPASMCAHTRECSDKELAYLKRVRLNVFNLALVSVLANDKVAVRRREILDLFYVQRLKPGEIYKREEFCGLTRNAFDQLVSNAKLEMTRPVLAFWKAVAPKSCADSDMKLKKLWLDLSRSEKTWKLARKLYRRTVEEAGGLETI